MFRGCPSVVSPPLRGEAADMLLLKSNPAALYKVDKGPSLCSSPCHLWCRAHNSSTLHFSRLLFLFLLIVALPFSLHTHVRNADLLIVWIKGSESLQETPHTWRYHSGTALSPQKTSVERTSKPVSLWGLTLDLGQTCSCNIVNVSVADILTSSQRGEVVGIFALGQQCEHEEPFYFWHTVHLLS